MLVCLCQSEVERAASARMGVRKPRFVNKVQNYEVPESSTNLAVRDMAVVVVAAVVLPCASSHGSAGSPTCCF